MNKEISQVNSLLIATKKNEKSALEDLSDLNRKIAVRLQLIKTINLEANILSKGIKKNEQKLSQLNKELTALKKDYAAMIYKSYKSKSQQSKMLFVLSSQSFYQAYKRLEYMKQYTSFRKKQGEAIVTQAVYVQKLKDSLLFKKKAKDTLIIGEQEQKQKIEVDKNKQEQLISEIKKKESKYKRELQKKIREEKRIAQRIDKLIKAEIERANRLARAKLKVKPKTTKKSEFILSPEAKALANKFELNKGKLPWPVKEGLITRKFGIQKHPTIGGITLNSTGLHINTSAGMYAESIFNGEVLTIQRTAEGRKNVLVRHGSYISTYKNLESTLVNVGDKVKTGEKLGKIFTDKVTGKTKLIFVLFKNTVRLNPAYWIIKR
ncbi:peptidoglycan DD-metalloendopeptidase family protein [uncultured Polaribacter sp.]|uniref:murein hydrolase activator EnvC family protein n=1 Tax=uncultured Polaribacter sp. TaxID=174711 RepID=UPI0026023B54|nr:peptidoglycan DD-metalloendopeptidase family protein [uncultured Polaribacter sp.]